MDANMKELALDKMAKIERLLKAGKVEHRTHCEQQRFNNGFIDAPLHVEFIGILFDPTDAIKLHGLLGELRTLVELA